MPTDYIKIGHRQDSTVKQLSVDVYDGGTHVGPVFRICPCLDWLKPLCATIHRSPLLLCSFQCMVPLPLLLLQNTVELMLQD